MATVHDDLAAEFAATAQDIFARLSGSQSVAAELDEHGFSSQAWAAAVDAGWMEAMLAESAGGLGLSLRELGPIFIAAGRHLFAGPFAEHAVAGALAASHANHPVADRLLVTLGGERRLALVDAAAAGAFSGERPALRGGRLSGACELVRFANQSDELLVVASTPAGPALALVQRERPGVSIAPRTSLDPVTVMASVAFEAVEVGDDDLVATGDAAWELLAVIRGGMRIAIACELSGIADHVLALAVDYAKEREQFGRPIGSFQALAHILAEMAREAFGLERLCREAAGVAMDDVARLDNVSQVAKAHAGSAARAVTEGSLQVHGGIAFTVEHPLHRYYKHVLFLEGLYGDRHELHEQLGRRLLAGAGDPWPAWR
jgi:alkylation response protein AidB-like acyl-CoA dehydrogenase